MGTLAVIGNGVGSGTYSALGMDEFGNLVSQAPWVLTLLSSVLEHSIQNNVKLLSALKKNDAITVFHGSKAPAFSLRRYIQRIFKYSACSPSCFVVAHIYMDRFLQRTNGCLTSLNVHRLLVTSVMVAAKFNEKVCYNNAYYAKVGGVSTGEMNRLEMKFLFGVDFRLYVSTATFRKYCLQLEQANVKRPD